MIVFLNLKSFFRKSPLLSVAFLLTLTICLAGVLFGFNGILCGMEYYDRYLSDQRLYRVIGGADSRSFVSAFAQKEERLDYLSVFFTSGTENDDSALEMEAIVRADAQVLDLMAPVYGRMLSQKEIQEGARLATLDAGRFSSDRIGTHITIGERDYEIIGLTAGQSLVPFHSLSDSVKTGNVRILFSDVPRTAKERAKIYEELEISFPAMQIVAAPQNGSYSIFQSSPQILPVFLLVVFGLMNLLFLYSYFLRLRRRNHAVFRICGASRGRIFSLYLSEIATLFTAAYAVGVSVYRLVCRIAFPTEEPSIVASLGSSVIWKDLLAPAHVAAVYGISLSILILAFAAMLFRKSSIEITTGGE